MPARWINAREPGYQNPIDLHQMETKRFVRLSRMEEVVTSATRIANHECRLRDFTLNILLLFTLTWAMPSFVIGTKSPQYKETA